MRNPASDVVVITGASGGLGKELAAAYARPGRHLLLCGRDKVRLAATAERAAAAGAQVETLILDLSEPLSVRAHLAAFAARRPVDLFIANAGVKTGNVEGVEDPVQLKRIVDVNLLGTILSVQAVLPAMLARGQGHIAILSSLAARSPHADLLSYSATKAGLEAYATGLRRAVLGRGIRVSLVRPGFIDTPMTDRHLGATPFRLSSAEAAHRIQKGLDRGQRTIAFPRRLALLVALRNALLPGAISDKIEAGFRARILPDTDEAVSAPAGSEPQTEEPTIQ